MRPQRQVSAENRLVSHNLWAQNRLSKTKSPKLNTCDAFFFYAWYRNLVTRAQPHTWILFVNAFGKSHNINFVAITELPKTTRNISTFNTGESSSNYSEKLSHSAHKSSMETFLDSHSRFIQDPRCKPAVEKETCSPRLPNNFWRRRLWPGQRSASISISPDKFHP